GAGRGRRGEGADAALLRPGGVGRPRRARPVLRRRQGVRDRARPGRGGLPRAARRAAVSLPELVRAATGRGVRAAARVGGGDINEGWRVELDDGGIAFAKTRGDVAAGEYAAEAAGLRWLAEPGALGIPQVLGVSDDVLVLEWVPE